MSPALATMASNAMNRVPDEIVSEILTPLLNHSDEMFCDQSEKPLLDPDHSASRYLLVSKSWLRVSTPSLYNVVILRTTAQAKALQAALKSTKDLGLFIKKLRVEGGFGNAMHTILQCAPNLSDLYLTLYIGGLDNVKGLCGGLSLINPRRVIVVDCPEAVPKKNKKVTELLETLLHLITKWDKMQTFQFPYVAFFVSQSRASVVEPRAAALVSALAKSRSLKTLIVPIGIGFPSYLRPLVNSPSLKSIHFRYFNHLKYIHGPWWLRSIREAVDQEPQLKALVTYSEFDGNGNTDTNDVSGSLPHSPTRWDRERAFYYRGKRTKLELHENGDFFSSETSHAYADSLTALKRLGETIGGTLKSLTVSLNAKAGTIDPTLLTPFTSLTFLNWLVAKELSFSTPGSGFSALPLLEELTVRGESKTPSLLDIMQELPLDSLRAVEFMGHIPAAVAFLRCHGAKLQELWAPFEFLVQADTLNLCTALNTVKVRRSGNDSQGLSENFISCSTPHGSLAKIHFEDGVLGDTPVLAVRSIFERLNSETFPYLKEIQIDDIKWPTSEQEARKNEWISLSELLHSKSGIKLTDGSGVSGSTGLRRKGKGSSRQHGCC